MAHVLVSGAQFDVQMYTNDAKARGYELIRDMSHPTAIQQETAATQKIEPHSECIQVAQRRERGLRNGCLPIIGFAKNALIPGTAMEMAGLRLSLFMV